MLGRRLFRIEAPIFAKYAGTLRAADAAALGNCLDVFEDFCVVTQSVREGIDVEVTVEPRATEQPTPGSARRDVVDVA